MPISREVQEITGITDAMVRGQRLDEARIAQMLEGVDLVVAHNAGFDRPFCESRLPQFRQMRWGCSIADMNWKAAGYGSAKLEQLALHNGWFYDAHRAEVDCHALLAVLGVPLAVNRGNAMQAIVTASAQPSYRLQATSAPFDSDALKARATAGTLSRKWHTLPSDATPCRPNSVVKSSVYHGRSARVRRETRRLGQVLGAPGEIAMPSLRLCDRLRREATSSVLNCLSGRVRILGVLPGLAWAVGQEDRQWPGHPRG
jgi:DNA polymerase-3 subunit epsilon